MNEAFLYRRFPLDQAGLRALLTEVFKEQQVWAFASNSVKLLPIEPSAVADVQLSGDKGNYHDGHVFNKNAEVRWKLRGGHYDALILAEQERQQAEPLRDEAGNQLILQKQAQPQGIAILLDSEHKGHKLRYIEYVAPNGAVQFQRFVFVEVK